MIRATPVRSIHGLLTVAVIVALAVPLTGCFLQQKRDLERHVRQAEEEMRRLDYVVKRDAELRAQQATLRGAIEAAAAHRAVEPVLPPTPVGDVAPRFKSWATSTPPTTIPDLVQRLEFLNGEISNGINVERKLPALEREIESLKARLAEIEALPVTAAPPG